LKTDPRPTRLECYLPRLRPFSKSFVFNSEGLERNAARTKSTISYEDKRIGERHIETDRP
jgi:hypothetical protein